MQRLSNKFFALIFVLTTLAVVLLYESVFNMADTNFNTIGEIHANFTNIPTDELSDMELTYKGAEYTMADLAELAPWYEAGMQLSCAKNIRNASETPYILVVKGENMETQMVEVVVKKKVLTVTLTSGGWTVGETPVVPTAMGLKGVCDGDEDKVILNTAYYDSNNNLIEDISKVGVGTYTMQVTLTGSAVNNYEFEGAIGKTFVVSEKPVAGTIDNDENDDQQAVAWILWGVIGGVVMTVITTLTVVVIKHCKSHRSSVTAG